MAPLDRFKDRPKTTWRIALDLHHKDDKIIACTLTEEELDSPFDPGYGGSEGKPFTAWSKDYVYFPVVYDGAEWVGRVRRDPCDEASQHHGGE